MGYQTVRDDVPAPAPGAVPGQIAPSGLSIPENRQSKVPALGKPGFDTGSYPNKGSHSEPPKGVRG